MYILYFFTPACRSYLNIVQELNIKYSFQNIVEYRSIFTVFTVDKNTLLYSAIFMAIFKRHFECILSVMQPLHICRCLLSTPLLLCSTLCSTGGA